MHGSQAQRLTGTLGSLDLVEALSKPPHQGPYTPVSQDLINIRAEQLDT